MQAKYIVGIIIVSIILLLAIILIVLGSMGYFESSAPVNQQIPPGSIKINGDANSGGIQIKSPIELKLEGKPIKKQYVFYPGKDSNGGDIIHKADIINNVPELQKYCTSLPNCKGFNTNAWVKHTIVPESQWVHWTDDPQKGLYLRS